MMHLGPEGRDLRNGDFFFAHGHGWRERAVTPLKCLWSHVGRLKHAVSNLEGQVPPKV